MTSTLRLAIVLGGLVGATYLMVRGIPVGAEDPFHVRVDATDVQQVRSEFVARVGRDPEATELRQEVDQRVRR